MQQQTDQEAAEKPNMPSYGTVVRCIMALLICSLSLILRANAALEVGSFAGN